MFRTSTQPWYFNHSPIRECQASPPGPGQWRASVWYPHCMWPRVCPHEIRGEGALPGLQPPGREKLSMNLLPWCPHDLGCLLPLPTMPPLLSHTQRTRRLPHPISHYKKKRKRERTGGRGSHVCGKLGWSHTGLQIRELWVNDESGWVSIYRWVE